MATTLDQAIENKTALVGVVGLGYVGLPLIRAFIAAGYRTMGFDVDQTKVDGCWPGESYIGHISVGVDRRVHPQQEVHADGRHDAGWPRPTPS